MERRSARVFPLVCSLSSLVAGLVIGAAGDAAAQSIESFYTGKTVTVAIGFRRRRLARPVGRLMARQWANIFPASLILFRRIIPAPAA